MSRDCDSRIAFTAWAFVRCTLRKTCDKPVSFERSVMTSVYGVRGVLVCSMSANLQDCQRVVKGFMDFNI